MAVNGECCVATSSPMSPCDSSQLPRSPTHTCIWRPNANTYICTVETNEDDQTRSCASGASRQARRTLREKNMNKRVERKAELRGAVGWTRTE